MPNSKQVTVSTDNATATTTLFDKLPYVPLNVPQGMKAIGPRVTFHFISGEWSKDNTYDSYDVVNSNGASYVAIQPVPAGIELSNEDYWFYWSEPNAQFNELQSTVESFDSRMSTAESMLAPIDNSFKDILVTIGDSWTMSNTQVTPWPNLLASILNLQLFNMGTGSSGYVADSGSSVGGTFFKQVQTVYNELNSQDRVKRVKYIIIYGGVNDVLYGYSAVQISTAMNSLVPYLKTNFPQAQVIFVCGNGQKTFNINEIAVYDTVYNIAVTNGFAAVINARTWVTANNYQDDNLHPNVAGQLQITSHMLAAINGMNGYSSLNVGMTLTDSEHYKNLSCLYGIYNNIAYLQFSLTTSVQVQGGINLKIAEPSSNEANHSVFSSASPYGLCFTQSGIAGYWQFTNGALYLKLFSAIDADTTIYSEYKMFTMI